MTLFSALSHRQTLSLVKVRHSFKHLISTHCHRSYAKKQTTTQKGRDFEKRIETLLIKLGKFPVSHDVPIRDQYGHLSQIDVKYGLFRPRYVECKCYSPNHKVPLEDVAKFALVLQANRIPVSRGLFITSSTYKPRALTVGMECWDGDDVESFEKQVKYRLLFRLLALGFLFSFSYYLVFVVYWNSLLDQHRDRIADEETHYYAQKMWNWMKQKVNSAAADADKQEIWKEHLSQVLPSVFSVVEEKKRKKQQQDALPHHQKSAHVPWHFKLIIILESLYNIHIPEAVVGWSASQYKKGN